MWFCSCCALWLHCILFHICYSAMRLQCKYRCRYQQRTATHTWYSWKVVLESKHVRGIWTYVMLQYGTATNVCSFYVRQLYRQVLLRACISYGNSVCLSITTRYRFKARWDTDMPTIPLLAELFRISAVFPPFRAEFVKFCFSIPFIWAIKTWYFHT